MFSIRRRLTSSSYAIPLPPKRGERVNHGNTQTEKPKSFARYCLKYITSRPKTLSDFTIRLVGTALLAWATIQTPGTWRFANFLARWTGLVPKISKRSVATPPHINGIIFDNFVGHYDGFDKVAKAVSRAHLEDSPEFDTNNNGIACDTSVEIENLIKILEDRANRSSGRGRKIVEEAIEVLKEIKTVSKYLWEGDDIQQIGPNCPIAADIIGNFLTSENIQRIKGYITSVSLNTEGPMPYLKKATVHLPNGRSIEVTSEDLSRPPRSYIPVGSIRGAQIFAYAVEKELKGHYCSIPLTLPSSSSTLISGETYSTIPLMFLSDQALIEVLNEAPNIVIKLCSYPTNDDYSKRLLASIINVPDEKPSEEEPKDYKIRPNHDYTVKGFKNQDGKYIAIVKTCDPGDENNQKEVVLTMDEMRKHMAAISVPPRMISAFNILDFEVSKYYAILLSLLVFRLRELRKDYTKLQKAIP